jgi:dCMP deaminase
VVYHNGYRDDSGIQFLLKAGVEVEHIPELQQ